MFGTLLHSNGNPNPYTESRALPQRQGKSGGKEKRWEKGNIYLPEGGGTEKKKVTSWGKTLIDFQKGPSAKDNGETLERKKKKKVVKKKDHPWLVGHESFRENKNGGGGNRKQS